MNGTKRRKLMKYRSYPAMVAGCLGVYFAFAAPGDQKKLALVFFGLTMLLIYLSSLGALSYAKANKIIKAHKDEDYIQKAIPYLERALKFGIEGNGEVAVGTVVLQHGDKERGREILEDIASDPDKKLASSAMVSLSMYWWMKKDDDKAIELCEEARKAGNKERNLYINLSTYYFEKDMEKEFHGVIKEARDNNAYTNALTDLEAAYSIRKGDWHKALNLTSELFASSNPAFIDPYLHHAMGLLHFGETEEAIRTMEKIGEKVMYSNTSIYTKEEVETLITLMKDEETLWGLVECVNEDPEIFFQNRMPEVQKGVEKPKEFPRLPELKATEVVKETKAGRKDDEREISTDLTDEDEEWLKRHAND